MRAAVAQEWPRLADEPRRRVPPPVPAGTPRDRIRSSRAAGCTPAAERGSTLVEALVALGLVAFAGLVVATAAGTGLRATRRAATVAAVTALAARELALLEARAATAVDAVETRAVVGFPDPIDVVHAVTRDGALVTLQVQITGGRPPAGVSLTTRALVPE